MEENYVFKVLMLMLMLILCRAEYKCFHEYTEWKCYSENAWVITSHYYSKQYKQHAKWSGGVAAGKETVNFRFWYL